MAEACHCMRGRLSTTAGEQGRRDRRDRRDRRGRCGRRGRRGRHKQGCLEGRLLGVHQYPSVEMAAGQSVIN